MFLNYMCIMLLFTASPCQLWHFFSRLDSNSDFGDDVVYLSVCHQHYGHRYLTLKKHCRDKNKSKFCMCVEYTYSRICIFYTHTELYILHTSELALIFVDPTMFFERQIPVIMVNVGYYSLCLRCFAVIVNYLVQIQTEYQIVTCIDFYDIYRIMTIMLMTSLCPGSNITMFLLHVLHKCLFQAIPFFVALMILEVPILFLQGKKLPRFNDGFSSIANGLLSLLHK